MSVHTWSDVACVIAVLFSFRRRVCYCSDIFKFCHVQLTCISCIIASTAVCAVYFYFCWGSKSKNLFLISLALCGWPACVQWNYMLWEMLLWQGYHPLPPSCRAFLLFGQYDRHLICENNVGSSVVVWQSVGQEANLKLVDHTADAQPLPYLITKQLRGDGNSRKTAENAGNVGTICSNAMGTGTKLAVPLIPWRWNKQSGITTGISTA